MQRLTAVLCVAHSLLSQAYLWSSLGTSPFSPLHFVLEVEDILVIVISCRRI